MDPQIRSRSWEISGVADRPSAFVGKERAEPQIRSRSEEPSGEADRPSEFVGKERAAPPESSVNVEEETVPLDANVVGQGQVDPSVPTPTASVVGVARGPVVAVPLAVGRGQAVHLDSQRPNSAPQPGPSGEARSSPLLKWRWIPVGTLDLTLSHAATLSDVRAWLRSTRSTGQIPRRLSSVSTVGSPPVCMERGRGDSRAGSNKRSFDDFNSEEGRGYEREVRERRSFADENRRRDRDRDWTRDRAREPEWRRDGGRWREEEDRPVAGSSGARDLHKKKWGINRQGAQPPKAKSVSHSTPQAPPAPTPPPVASSDAAEVVPANKKANIKCYNCSRDGHYQSGCHFPAHCGVCDLDGHTTGMCPKNSKKASLQWYGYALDGVGFHCLEMEEEALPVGSGGGTAHTALVIAVENTMTCDLLTQDLKALVEDNWDWRVRRISDTDFAVVFPTKASLNLCKNLCKNAGGIALPVSKISVLFADATATPQASLALTKIWVHLSGVPEVLRSVDLLLEGTKMLGRPRVVDEESLAALDGPVRMLFHCHAPDKIPSSIMLFINLQGFRLGVSVECAKASVSDPKPPPPGPSNGDDDEEEEETEDQSRSAPHWKRSNMKSKDKGPMCDVTSTKADEAEAGKDGSADKSPLLEEQRQKPLPFQSSVGSSSVPLPSLKDHSATKPASAPPKYNLKPIPFNQYGSNLTEAELFPSAKACLSPVPQASEKAQTSSESKSEEPISPNILKRQRLSAEDRLEVGWESPEDWENDQETLAEKIAKLKRKQDGEVDNPPSRIKKKPGVKPKRAVVTSSPVTATRRSTRGKGANPEHVLLSASKRAAEKYQGTPSAPALTDPFLVLPSVSNSHLWGVARDAGLGLDVSTSSPSSLLSLIRAKELAQARLTEAALIAKLKEEEAQKQKQTQAESVAYPASVAQDLPTEDAPNVTGTDPERITLAEMAKASRTTRRKKGEYSTGSRPNLRDTPARQARASAGASK
ncbi:hypothetical protein QYE76_031336 [Lolium multiflorum]|uniref:CCHC-type domain-containing protein n=1 Tax=Lolium multiflorum TaxID=4521 RepID=A0AAD8QV52_LOLMU|nr:hypothetical protein QYE76_031336 [Lolium multiflorum]